MNENGQPTTLAEIEALPKNRLTPDDVFVYLGCNRQNINLASKAGTLPWAYQMGSRTIIPKEAFVNYHRYGRMQSIKSGIYSHAGETLDMYEEA